jgi:hypothetical protein
MFEIRRDLYMNEVTGEKSAGFERFAAAISVAPADITDFVESLL